MSISKIFPFQDKVTPDITLDTYGLACPLPLLKIKQTLSLMQPGQVLWVLATEASLQLDLKVLTRQTPSILLACHQESECFHFLVMKKSVDVLTTANQ